MHRATESFGLSRLFMFFLTGFVAYLGSVPGTLNAKAFDGAGAYWWAVAMIALLGTVDTVVNDLMPDKYRFQSGLHLRHITIMLCAWFFAAGTYLSIVNDVLSLTPFFVVCCINLVWHTFADIWRRYHDA